MVLRKIRLCHQLPFSGYVEFFWASVNPYSFELILESNPMPTLKVLTNEKRGGLKVVRYHSISLALSFLRGPHPVRGLKLLGEPCFCHLKSIIVFKHGINIGLRHSSHIIHFTKTTVLQIFAANRETSKNRLSIKNLFKQRDNHQQYFEYRQRIN